MRLLSIPRDLPGRSPVSSRDRLWVAALLAGAVLAACGLVAFANVACPGPTVSAPCEQALVNRAVVIVLAALTIGLAVTAIAWLATFRRRRIAYRGAWATAIRRGLLAAAACALLAGLRMGDALNALSVAVVLGAGVATDWAVGRSDSP